MKISLRNIGKLREADVEINGVTVIAGENNTGKSTVGKALFSVFNGFFEVKRTIKDDKFRIPYLHFLEVAAIRFCI